jgi:hypothetical protein
MRYNTFKALVESEVLGKIVAGLVWEVVAETANLAAHFAMAQQQIVGANGYTLYAFAQCIPRVTRSNCRFCLDVLINANVFLPLVGGESSALWCQFQWELYPYVTGTSSLAEGKLWDRLKIFHNNFRLMTNFMTTHSRVARSSFEHH